MRLQLTVQRHSLPPAQILWTAGVLRPPYAAAGASCTISQFLEQVNEVIPLECEDWGLEDYAVEVRGFECLHFAEIEQVLREDDEVCIRPLQTLDLRFRKVSGRHQISVDGKHLIDGVAFGRPFLRRADRPAIRIPPRKRRKISYEEESEDIELGANDRQVVIRADSNHINDSDKDSGSKDNEDFSAIEEEGLAEELAGLHEDLHADDDMNMDDDERALYLDGSKELSGRSTRSQGRRKTGLGLEGPAVLELTDENGRPYPEEYANPLLDLLAQDEHNREALSDGSREQKRMNRVWDTTQNIKDDFNSPIVNPRCANGRASIDSMNAGRLDDTRMITPPTVRLEGDIQVFDDEGAENKNTLNVDMDESDKENAKPRDGKSDSDESLGIEDDTSSAMSTSSESSIEDTSSSGSSSSSDSDSDDENLQSSLKGRSIASSSGTTCNSSSSDSDSSESGLEKLPNSIARDSTDIASLKGEVQIRVPPFKGKSATQKRNQRRRDNKSRAFLVEKGVLPPNATLADFRAMGGNLTAPTAVKLGNVVQEPALNIIDTTAKFEAKRMALLASIDAGGVYVGRDDKREAEPPAPIEENIEYRAFEKFANDFPGTYAQTEIEDSQKPSTSDMPLEKQATPTRSIDIAVLANRDAAVPAQLSDSPRSPKRRAKLDLASSRRLVFGSLGLRTPKTKDDEISTREKLMRDVRPTKETQASKNIHFPNKVVPDSIGEDESWKENVILEAVECCNEGVVLSTPPFPFVQRWDPQQQLGHRGRGRGKTNSKKRKRKSKQYHEDYEYQDAQYDASQYEAPAYLDDEPDEPLQDVRNNEIDEEAVNDQLMRESEDISATVPIEAEDFKDLPYLPEDMSLCSDLEQGCCIPGTIIAFKQLDMSAETNWQPRVSGYKTALIDQITDDGALRMTLAKRDQPVKEELYNDETGERVYGKFEMPGYEEAEGDEEDTIVELPFADLILPKLVQSMEHEQDEGQSRQLQDWDAGPQYRANIVVAQGKEGLYPSLEESNPIKYGGPQHNAEAKEVNGEVRKEIRELIEDAGWRSSIGSGVVEHGIQAGTQLSGTEKFSSGASDNKDNATKISSPRFNGFSSSPPPNRRGLSNVEAQADITGIETDESILPQTVAETVAAASPWSELLMSDKIDENASLDRHSDDQDVTWDNAPSGVGPAEDMYQPLSEKASSPELSLKPASRSSGRFGGTSQRETSPEPTLSFDGAGSDDEFPTLENVLASTRSSFESLMPEDDNLPLTAKSSSKIELPADEDQKRQRRSKSDAKVNIRKQSKSTPELRTFKDEDDGEFALRFSQIPLGSQIVDLTISSDPVYSPGIDEEDESHEMPSGPGWVRKTRSDSKQLSLGKGDSLRSRTRSSV